MSKLDLFLSDKTFFHVIQYHSSNYTSLVIFVVVVVVVVFVVVFSFNARRIECG